MIRVEKIDTTNVVVDAAEFEKCAEVSVNGWLGRAIPVKTEAGLTGSLIYVPNIYPERLNKGF